VEVGFVLQISPDHAMDRPVCGVVSSNLQTHRGTDFLDNDWLNPAGGNYSG
jgi:hypothetical protein